MMNIRASDEASVHAAIMKGNHRVSIAESRWLALVRTDEQGRADVPKRPGRSAGRLTIIRTPSRGTESRGKRRRRPSKINNKIMSGHGCLSADAYVTRARGWWGGSSRPENYTDVSRKRGGQTTSGLERTAATSRRLVNGSLCTSALRQWWLRRSASLSRNLSFEIDVRFGRCTRFFFYLDSEIVTCRCDTRLTFSSKISDKFDCFKHELQ